MDQKLNFVKDGVVRGLPGFGFFSTDEELVVEYLMRKVNSLPLPASIIPEFEVCKADPWNLPGDSEKVRHFFSTREAKYANGNQFNRATGSGFWKPTGLDKRIVASSGSNELVGMRKTLVFHRGKPPHASGTEWVMHEYRLVENPSQGMENWVICKIFLKKAGSSSSHFQEGRGDERSVEESTEPIFYDFMGVEKND